LNRRIFFTAVLLAVLLCSLSCGCGAEKSSGQIQNVKIGVSVYRKDDTFVSSLCTDLENDAKAKETESGTKINLNIVESQSSQALQNDQVDSFLSGNYNVICVNMVDRTAAAVIVDKAKKENVPVIFFNREPVEEDLRMWSEAYYVGADAAQSGTLQGEIIQNAFRKDPRSIDRNGDGVIQYVILEGEQGHQDALLRTEYSVKKLVDSGLKVEKLADDTANWQRAQGAAKMTQWIQKFGKRIEVVLCNNDDMALGAIDAVRESSLKSNAPAVVGVDGTRPGLEAIRDGSMLGTVLNDASQQAKAIFDLSYSFACGKGVPGSVKLTSGHYVKIPYRIVTKENLAKYLS
jgi:methyl-galactoside transport system substrate-binding protein